MKLKISLSLLLLALSTSCQYAENRYARRAVKPPQLVGTWTATDFSLRCLAKLPNEGHLTKSENEIVLRPDGTCSARGYLNPTADLASGSRNKYEVFNSECTWKLRDGTHQELVITTHANSAASFYFDDSEGKLLLWQYVTDPDAWQYVEFQRRSKT